MSNNQNILQEFGLVEELDEQAGEAITGGYTLFTITNKTKYNVPYFFDGAKLPAQFAKPGGSVLWTTYSGEIIIKFDADIRDEYLYNKSYKLSNGGKYEFQDKNYGPNPYEIDLYSVA